MTRKIKILPPVLSNQIAAGEVVDRPASIVKELAENSLDAGAKNIEVRIEEGGLKLIQVTDDGAGIHQEELILSVSPHATSKIYSLDELENLQTLGFRGEALASIASVSRFVLKSRPLDQTEGHEIQVLGDLSQAEMRPTALNPGSKIEVRDLFFNTPARRKFLKKMETEFSHIDDILKKIAMSHSDVTFSLYHNQKLSWKIDAVTSEASSIKRWKMLTNKDFYEQSEHIDVTGADFHLEGLIIKPKFMKRSSSTQTFFLNGRPIRDKLIFHAIKEAYRDVMYGDNQPAYVLFLEVDPKTVDFNVHPSKLEVRFREGRHVHDFVMFELKKALSGLKSLPSAIHTGVQAHEYEGCSPFCRDKKNEPESLKLYGELIHSKPEEARLSFDFHEESSQEIPLISAQTKRFGRALCQLSDIFILSEHQEGLMIIDMHAAHERILYEQLKAQWHEKSLPTQTLLLPQSVQLSVKEIAVFKEHEPLFPELGFEIEEWVDNKILIREVPVSLTRADLSHFIAELLHDLDLLGHSLQKENYLDQILAELACHSAIQAGQRLSLPEMNQLLQDMETTPRIEYCNHGRPTSSLLKKSDLDRLFLRGR